MSQQCVGANASLCIQIPENVIWIWKDSHQKIETHGGYEFSDSGEEGTNKVCRGCHGTRPSNFFSWSFVVPWKVGGKGMKVVIHWYGAMKFPSWWWPSESWDFFFGLGLDRKFQHSKRPLTSNNENREKYNFSALVLSTHILYHPLSLQIFKYTFTLHPPSPRSPKPSSFFLCFFFLTGNPRGSARKMPQAQLRPPMPGVASWELTKATALEAPKKNWITPWGGGDLWVTSDLIIFC